MPTSLPGKPVHLNLHDKFPNLKGETQNSSDFDLYEYLGNDWGIIFMHPGDFTPVCTTELGEAAARAPAFEERGIKICGFSCNSAKSHRNWMEDIEAATGNEVQFPMFCDPTRQISTSFGLLDPENTNAQGLPSTVRNVYILKPSKEIALIMSYPASCGRSFDEIFRVLESLQRTHGQGGVATPVDWFPGQDCIVDYSLTNAQADQKFGPDGYRVIDLPSEHGKDLEKNYLRKTKDPKFPE